MKQTGFKKELIGYVRENTTSISVYLIIILAFFIYSNTLDGKFIWDDHDLISGNIYIKNWSNLPKIFTRTIGLSASGQPAFYRPMQMLTYMIDYSLWRFNVQGYHLTNIFLHLLTALALYWLITLLFNDRFLSLLITLFFVAHPIQTEVVAYISGRADSLAALFMFLCFIFYVKQLNRNSAIYYLFMLSTYALALLSRENSLILPALLILYHYTFKKKFNAKIFLPLLLLGFVYIYLRTAVLKFYLPHTISADTLFQRIPGFFVAITNYLRLLFLPFGLHMEYGYKLFKLTDPEAILGAAISLALLIYAFKKKNNNKAVFFSISWFFLTLLPSSNLYPLNAYMAEHWLYLPAIGIFIILSKGLSDLYKAKNIKFFVAGFIICLIVFYSILAMMQNRCWLEPVSFYERTLKYTPASQRVYTNLASAYKEAGRKEKAIDLCMKAIEIDPGYVYAYNTLGGLYHNIGRRQEAIKLYKKAIAVDPAFAAAYYNLGLIYHDIGKNQETIELFKKAIAINPDFVDSYVSLGNIYKETGRNQEAIASYSRVIEIDPDFEIAYNNLGNIYFSIGKTNEALFLYSKAIEINPDFAQAYNNLGVLLCSIGKKQEAIALFRKAIEIQPDFSDPYRNLSKIYKDFTK